MKFAVALRTAILVERELSDCRSMVMIMCETPSIYKSVQWSSLTLSILGMMILFDGRSRVSPTYPRWLQQGRSVLHGTTPVIYRARFHAHHGWTGSISLRLPRSCGLEEDARANVVT